MWRRFASARGPIFVLLAFTSGCGRDDEKLAYDLLPEADGDPIVLDLIAEFPYAESWFEPEIIEPGLYADRAHLTGGWSFPNPRKTDEEDSSVSWLWAIEREAELTFHLSAVAPRHVRFAALAYLPDGGENSVTVRLNGEEIDGFALGPEAREYALPLPVQSQRAGMNRLSFGFSRSARPIDVGEGNETRSFAGCFGRFELECDDLAAEHRARTARTMVSRGSELALAGRAIEQVSGSLLRYHLEVPAAAVFTAQLGLVRRSARSVARARFRVTALRDGELPLVLLDEPVAWTKGGELERVRVPLDALAGQVVALELLVVAEPDDEVAVGVWGAPRVSAPAPLRVPVLEPPAVGEARGRLRHAPIVVILLDAFNPTFMTAYGGRAGLTPNLDALAAEGVLFEEVAAPASYTLSSIGTLLTSEPTWRHGVWNPNTPLRPAVETWAERFAAAGYRTAGIVCSVNGSSVFGYERGFETYVEVWKELKRDVVVPAHEVLPFLEQALVAPADDDRPLFLWIHVMEPHEPYDDSPAPWGGRFDPGYDGAVTGTTEMLSDIRDGVLVPSARDVEHLKAQYEEGLGYVDEVLGRMRARLAEAGFLDEGVLAIVSDHGEAFMEHRPGGRVLISHGTTVYDDMVRVPLLVRLPGAVAALGARERRAERRVSSADLLPTLADLAGVAPGEHAPGASFASLLFGAEGYERRVLSSHSYSNAEDRFMPEFALWAGDHKLIYRSGGDDELYAAGRREEHDLSDELPVRAGWMRQLLHRELGFDPDEGGVQPGAGSTELAPDALEQMRALGYVR